ncbi:class I SAM-dependent methyltransferase [Polynucleobacter sp. 78F-HAINBA]|uniref:class I SAM-dependent methyltransferase n=1 Tax=Polynucleobacter sp. 78F-HAINBA TaxID=2689099 RepID=UPI001C0C74A7|nr:class I SAM-dependent methyltransferase [Polynucleobacter sp. 78F-HAINBA]MBU3590676.1 class I SAM-dependent methyltransferase [Polynucleobacter sp. 78F-HAINBA]
MLKRILKYSHWQLSRLVKALDRDSKKYHDDSVQFQKLMAANTERVFEQMYADPQLLQHYLVKSRLDFYRLVASKVADLFTGDKVGAACVDIGCGTGHLLAELRKSGFGGRLVGLDSATAAGDQVRSHGANLEFYPGYLSDQKWRKEFDLVLCTEVLEHCDYPAEIVREMIQVTKTGGMIAITVPDGRNDTWEGHIHFWSPESFKLFIEGFQINATFDYFENTNFCMLHC